ncbi:MAG: TrmB family transcriptional regulator [Phycisphaerae bacterium]|nr:TrmB family transcriptional regulator [Phycisphaerae bacterium]
MVQAFELLETLGLNHLEAEVYVLLLRQQEPITAYRIGKDLGKPTANVYKAIEALARKGAVIIDHDEPRLCRPVPAEEFLGQLEETYQRTTRHAASRLAHLGQPAPDERVYQIQSVPLVLERCRSMLDRAQRIVVVDAFPRAMEAVRPAIDKAIARGVDAYVQAYEPTDIAGAHLVQAYQSDPILRHWRSQQLNCVVDGREVLLALLHNDLCGVHQAVWTGSLFLACVLHAGFLREYFFHDIAAMKDGDDFPPALRAMLEGHPSFHGTDVPGHKLLFARLGVDEERNG